MLDFFGLDLGRVRFLCIIKKKNCLFSFICKQYMLSRWHYFEIWLDFILYRPYRNLYSCLCVFIEHLCVCVWKRKKKGRKKKKCRGKWKETERNNDNRKGSSNTESIWKQPHLVVSKSWKIEQSHHMEIYPSNGFLSWIFNANVQAIAKYRRIMKKRETE